MSATTTTSVRVIGWTDGNCADLFEDSHGYHWRTFVDAADGTIAVERTDGVEAGVFRWQRGTADRGDLYPAKDGATYGVNCLEEFVVRDGRWVENIR